MARGSNIFDSQDTGFNEHVLKIRVDEPWEKSLIREKQQQLWTNNEQTRAASREDTLDFPRDANSKKEKKD